MISVSIRRDRLYSADLEPETGAVALAVDGVSVGTARFAWSPLGFGCLVEGRGRIRGVEGWIIDAIDDALNAAVINAQIRTEHEKERGVR